MGDLIKCSNCSRLPQPKEEFIGCRNRVCKLCRKCREKYNKQNSTEGHKELVERWRGNNREKIIEQCRKASNAWVQREKEKDTVAYNAKLQAKRKKCATTKLNQMKTSATKRDLLWELADYVALEMVKSPCVYCGFINLDITVNSIDRLDSSKNYTPSNCVPCCTHCNIMKGCYDPITFIERCRKIGECKMMFTDITKCDLPKTQTRKRLINNQSSQDA
jgi:hypothetical protein